MNDRMKYLVIRLTVRQLIAWTLSYIGKRAGLSRFANILFGVIALAFIIPRVEKRLGLK